MHTGSGSGYVDSNSSNFNNIEYEYFRMFPLTMFKCPLPVYRLSDSPLSTLDQQAGAEQFAHAAITEDCIVFIHFKLQCNFMCVMFISDVLENWNAGLAHPQSQQ